MALNLWKVGGNPTAYDPIPYPNARHDNFFIGKYVLRFKARTETGSTLKIVDSAFISANYSLELTDEFQYFELELNRKTNGGSNSLYIGYGMSETSHFEIKDIELVEAPLGKLTLNGIPPFTSEEWILSDDVTVIDEETAVLESDATTSVSDYWLKVDPGALYTIYVEETKRLDFSPFTAINGTYTGGIKQVTSGGYNTLFIPNNANYVRVRMQNDGQAGVFTFKRPMLVKGTTPIPYEPKKGTLMVEPKTAGKNLIRGEKEENNSLFNQGNGSYGFPNEWVDGKLRVVNGSSSYNGIGIVVKVKPGKIYTFSCKALNSNDGSEARVLIGNSGKTYDYDPKYYPAEDPPVTFTPTKDYVYFNFLKDLATDYNNPVYFWEIQLEEGETATSYEPHKYGVNQYAKGEPLKRPAQTAKRLLENWR